MVRRFSKLIITDNATTLLTNNSGVNRNIVGVVSSPYNVNLRVFMTDRKTTKDLINTRFTNLGFSYSQQIH